MDPDHWQAIDSLFHRVVDLDPAARRAIYRDEKTPEAVRKDVEDLIAADPRSGDPHLDMIRGEVHRAGHDAFDVNRVGEKIGGYELLRELGRGGQGVVYLARRQDGELRGHVAIKILQASLTARDMQRRFRQERQILSGLEHPNIARFLDAGTTPDGWLFLALEAVEGEPIDRYCEHHDLDLDARLDLFCRAAGAVQAAHRQLIIHRDIKPSNLLVTDEGTPKLLDFGIAKLLDAESPLAETRPGVRHLTPEAASPEQILGETLSTAAVIYALGLLLYRLLSGKPAYTFERRTPAEIERVVCRHEPMRPSLAAGRSELRGDLDAIILQALRKKPDERYASVEAMVEDIRRYQRQEPIRARPASFLYRANKVVQRHRRPLAALLLFSSLCLFFVAELRQQRDRAVENATISLDILDNVDKLGLDVLPEFMASILPNFDEYPQLQVQLMSTLGAIFHARDEHGRASEMLFQAIERREALGDGDPLRIAADRHRLGVVQLESGEYEKARASFQEGYAEVDGATGKEHWLAAKCLAGLAEVDYEEGDFEQSLPGVEQSLEIFRRLLGGRKPSPVEASDLVRAFDLLAGIHYQLGEPEKSLRIQRDALDMAREALGPESLAVETLLSNHGMVLRVQGRYEEAVEAFRESIRINQVNLESGSIRLGIRLLNLGNTYRRQGEVELAVESCREALEMTARFGGPQHPNIPRIERCLERAREARAAGA